MAKHTPMLLTCQSEQITHLYSTLRRYPTKYWKKRREILQEQLRMHVDDEEPVYGMHLHVFVLDESTFTDYENLYIEMEVVL